MSETTGVKVRETTGYLVFKWFNTVIMIFVCAVTLYPFLYLVAQSFSSEEAITLGKVTLWPIGFNVETYKSVLAKGEFLHAYKNTVVYSVLGTILSLVFSCCMAYPLSKKELKGYRKASDTEGDYTSDLRASPEGEYTVAVYDKYSMLVPYIVGTDSGGNRAWYTTGTLDSSGPITEEEVLQMWRDAEPKKEHINVGGNQ